MKRLHRSDLFGWSMFQEHLDLDFNSVAWIRPEGNVVIDPLPLSAHDRAHLAELGGVAWVVITNSMHARASADLAQAFGAKLAGPAAERERFPIACERWLKDGDQLVPGLGVVELDGSKTPGELALILDGTTLVTGDLVRAHRAGSLMMLSPEKLADRARAIASLERLVHEFHFDAILVGDGFSVFRDGHARLEELIASLGKS